MKAISKIFFIRFAELLVMVAFFFPINGHTANASESIELIRCTGALLGAPTYYVKQDTDSGGRIRYSLTKQPNNPMYGPYGTEIDSQNLITYGDTFILTVNHGRSGYAHIYARGSLVVIDVNLFQEPNLNSDGALTKYTCQRN